METRTLALYPYPNPALPAIKTLKATMNLDFLVAPRAAVAGGSARVLGTVLPPFACDVALVRSSAGDLRGALEWALGLVDENPQVIDMAGWLSVALGARVEELASEGVTSAVRFE